MTTAILLIVAYMIIAAVLCAWAEGDFGKERAFIFGFFWIILIPVAILGLLFWSLPFEVAQQIKNRRT